MCAKWYVNELKSQEATEKKTTREKNKDVGLKKEKIYELLMKNLWNVTKKLWYRQKKWIYNKQKSKGIN